MRCRRPLGSCSPVCPLGVLPVQCPSPLVSCPAICALGVCVPCPWPVGSCSLVCLRRVLCGVRGVLGHLAPVHQCAACVTLATISPPGVAPGRFVGDHQSGLAGCKSPPLFKRGTFSWSSQRQRQRQAWGASPRPSAPTYLPTYLPVYRPRPLGSCSPVCKQNVLHVRCHWPLGSCSPVCRLGVLYCVCTVHGHFAPVHRRARSVCCVVHLVSLAT